MITTTRILIVDDHAPFRRALREFLSQEPGFEIVGEAGNLREALRSVGSLSPDLVLTDLTMPDAHGIEAVTKLKRHFPNAKILVVSLHCENEYKHQCREAGAAGYIVKDAIHDELLDAMRAVLAGKTYMGAGAPEDRLLDYVVGSAASNENRGYLVH